MQNSSETHGRLVRLEFDGAEARLTILNEAGIHETKVSASEASASGALVGDLVRSYVDNSQVLKIEVLTRNRLGRQPNTDAILHPRRLKALAVRQAVEDETRSFFMQRGFREVRTPLLVPNPGMEIHIRPFQVQAYGEAGDDVQPPAFLPTSPEFAMKRLLVGGLEKIFQMSTAFRSEPNSNTHRPEFLMLEFYRAYSNIEAIMSDTENLVAELAEKVCGKAQCEFQGQLIDLSVPWPRLSVRSLFQKYLEFDLGKCGAFEDLECEALRLGVDTAPDDTWDDLYYRMWLNLIEPKLPKDRPVFVVDYPPSQAALAQLRTDSDGTTWAKRCEFYIGGLEIGNGFDELTDPAEQRRRFVQDMLDREEIYGDSFPATPQDEVFLESLAEGMPPAGGIAIGMDRIIMLLANEADIGFTRWLD